MHSRRIRVAFLISALVLSFAFLFQLSLAAQEAPGTDSSSDLDQLLISKDSGLLTDWRFVGPFGSSADFSRVWAPERDGLQKSHYGRDRVRNLQFTSGEFVLPSTLSKKRSGMFYASSDVWLPSGGDWRLYAETAGQMVVSLDGKATIRRTDKGNDPQTTSEVIHLGPGTHRILVKFDAAAAPFRLAVMPETGGLPSRNNKPNIYRNPESQYTSAKLHWPE